MKTLRIIQNIAAVIAMITALSIADGSDATRTEIWSATLMLLLMVLMLLARLYYEQKNEKREGEK